MNKKNFDRLAVSIRQAGAIRRGEMKPGRVTEFIPDDVKAIRQRLGKSQSEFALMIGVSVSTLQNWEQGRRVPEGPAAPAEGRRQKPTRRRPSHGTVSGTAENLGAQGKVFVPWSSVFAKRTRGTLKDSLCPSYRPVHRSFRGSTWLE